MNSAKVHILKNPSDGSCLFHTVSQAVGISAQNLRKSVASQVTEIEFQIKKASMSGEKAYAWMKRVDTLEQYKKIISSDEYKIWGDTEAICHLENILGCRIVVFDARRKTVIRHGSTVARPRFYLLTYYSGNHFELVATPEGFRCLTLSELRECILALKK